MWFIAKGVCRLFKRMLEIIKSCSSPLFKNHERNSSAAETLAPVGYYEQSPALGPTTSAALGRLERASSFC